MTTPEPRPVTHKATAQRDRPAPWLLPWPGACLPSTSTSAATVYNMSDRQDLEQGWWGLHWLKVVGIVLTSLSIVATVILAWRGAEEQPTGSEVALFALLVAFFQLGAAWAFSHTGRVDLIHAGSSVRRLGRLAVRAEDATAAAQRARAKSIPPEEVRDVMNQLSVELSVLQEGFVDAADDWMAALPGLINQPKKATAQEDSRLL